MLNVPYTQTISTESRNVRIKKAYFVYLKEADQKSNTTINGIRKAILRLEEYTNFFYGLLPTKQLSV